MSLSKNVDRYAAFGIGLMVFGILCADYSFFILHNIPLTALGILCVVMGATSILIPNEPVPTESARAIMEGACINLEALLEEFNAVERGIYLPPRDGRVYAYVPLGKPLSEELIELIRNAPFKVITSVEDEPGLMVFPPGSEIVRLMKLEKGADIEETLSHVLVDFVEGIESLKAVHIGDKIYVQMKGVRFTTEFPHYRKALGSLPTSVAGCVLSSILMKPVSFLDENISGNLVEARFKVEKTG